jgi:hypothetical protein
MRAQLTRCMGVMTMGIGAFTLLGRGADSSEKWMGFAAYPGARELCNEVVLGQSEKGRAEIHWRSFASRDAPAGVVAFYAKREGKNAQRSSDSIEVRRGADQILSVYSASKTGVPSCASKPNSEEKTIIMVSIRRQRPPEFMHGNALQSQICRPMFEYDGLERVERGIISFFVRDWSYSAGRPLGEQHWRPSEALQSVPGIRTFIVRQIVIGEPHSQHGANRAEIGRCVLDNTQLPGIAFMVPGSWWEGDFTTAIVRPFGHGQHPYGRPHSEGARFR